MLFTTSLLASAAALLPLVSAQTFTSCNPLQRDDCPVDTALGTSALFNWTQTAADSQIWNTTNGNVDFTPDGASFKIAGKQQSPTLESLFYIFWGRVSVVMKAAGGQGIVSSVVLESDDLDEIDWEWIGGNTTHVQTNFFGKGDSSTYDRAVWHPVDNTLDEHNYTVVWTQQQTDFYIDGKNVRTLKFTDPLAMTKNKTLGPKPGDRYPQTPMTIKVGNWAGGDPNYNSNGTVEWAGGNVDYSKGPFVQMIKSIEAVDFSQGSSYSYGDRTGSFGSIKLAAGNSTIYNRLHEVHGINNRWNSLPKAAQIGIIAGAITVAAILLVLMTFCCIKNRRAGRKERAIADAEWERQLQELSHYKRQMVSEEEIHPRAGVRTRGGKAGYI